MPLIDNKEEEKKRNESSLPPIDSHLTDKVFDPSGKPPLKKKISEDKMDNKKDELKDGKYKKYNMIMYHINYFSFIENNSKANLLEDNNTHSGLFSHADLK